MEVCESIEICSNRLKFPKRMCYPGDVLKKINELDTNTAKKTIERMGKMISNKNSQLNKIRGQNFRLNVKVKSLEALLNNCNQLNYISPEANKTLQVLTYCDFNRNM